MNSLLSDNKTRRLYDRYGRSIDYLRISVTDRCNLRCTYCMPENGVIFRDTSDILSFEEIIRVVKAAADLGIHKIRLTGGEPLARKEIAKLIGSLSRIKSISDLSITTNGTLLKYFITELKEAGLKRINISLDTLNEKKYKLITGTDYFRDNIEGVDKSLEAGLFPVKINTVMIKGINDDEIEDFVRLAVDKPLSLRFIEFMPVGQNSFWEKKKFIPVSEIKERCRRLVGLEPIDITESSGPARSYKIRGGLGTVGFISPLSDPFCFRCTRLRLTADGHLRPCLFNEYQVDLKRPLREGCSREELAGLIRRATEHKEKKYDFQSPGSLPAMSKVGG